MSRECVEVVRMPLTVRAESRRGLEDWLRLRFPRVMAFWNRMVLRLSPRSRLRQTVLRHSLRRGLEAGNREDLDVAFAVHHPDVEAFFQPELVELGFDPVYRGRKARVRAEIRWREELGAFRAEPEELIDFGDGRVLVLAKQTGWGLRSGAEFKNEWAMLLTLSDGWVVREELFFDRAAALEAVGLSE